MSVVELVSSAGVVISLAFVAWQTRQLTEQTRVGNSIASLNAMYNGLDRLHDALGKIAEDPGLRPYFYEGEEPPGTNTPEGARTLLIAEILADAIDHGLMATDFMPSIKKYNGWSPYARYVRDSSPVVATVVRSTGWWPRLEQEWSSEARD